MKQAYDEAFQAAAALGVSVCVASGDNGSTDSVNDGSNHVDFPASSTDALGRGGARVAAFGWSIQSEVVWNDLPVWRCDRRGRQLDFCAAQLANLMLRIVSACGCRRPIEFRR